VRVTLSYAITQNRGLGDVGCTGVTVDSWNNQNRIPIYPDVYNIWLIKVSLDNAPSDLELQKKIESAFSDYWFNSGNLYSQNPGRAEIKSIRVLKVTQPSELVSMYPAPIATVQDTSNPQLAWQSGSFTRFVEVIFIYRGSLSQMYWPRMESGIVAISRYCPKDAAYGVYNVYPPDTTTPVPAENLCSIPGSFFSYSECRKDFLDKLNVSLPGFGFGTLIPPWAKFVGYGLIGYMAWKVVSPTISAAGGLGKLIAPKKEKE